MLSLSILKLRKLKNFGVMVWSKSWVAYGVLFKERGEIRRIEIAVLKGCFWGGTRHGTLEPLAARLVLTLAAGELGDQVRIVRLNFRVVSVWVPVTISMEWGVIVSGHGTRLNI